MSPTFHQETPLHEIVDRADGGICFYQGHNHDASYQLFILMLPKVARVVKHCYLELPKDFHEDFAKHAFGYPQDLYTKLNKCMTDPKQRAYVKTIVAVAHSVGIAVIPVYSAKTIVETNEKSLAESPASRAAMIAQRIAADDKMVECIRYHNSFLEEGEKFIGLFGGNHSQISSPRFLNCVSILFLNQPLNAGLYPSSDIRGSDARSAEHLKSFDIISLAPQKIADDLDLSAEITPCESVELLNALLKRRGIDIECKAYRRISSGEIDALSMLTKEQVDAIWPEIQKHFDAMSKSLYIPDVSGEISRLTFFNIENDKTKEMLSHTLRWSQKTISELLISMRSPIV